MKNKRVFATIGVLMALGVVVLISMVGINISRTAGELETVARENESQSEVIAWSEDRGRVTNPTDPGYAEPLGETSTAGPNLEKVMATAVSAQGMVLGLLSVCLIAIIFLVVKYLRGDRKQEQ